MGVFNLDRIFQPKTIAVIGATERKGTVGFAVMSNLIRNGFPGEIFPVNPQHQRVWDKPAFASILDLSPGPDLVVIATPIDSAPGIIRDCAKVGVKGAIIISAGGKETGEKGRQLESQIKKEAEPTGLRIIGPNCLGIISVKQKLNASFAAHMPADGKMVFISQSGAICTTILDLSAKENVGISHMVSLGSMLDVDFGDMIDYLGADPGVNSIVMYVENLSRIRNFMSAARAVSRIKPIIALKAGRSRAGAVAAASHTGAMAGEDAVYDAAFKRAGIVRVRTFEELFDCAELLAKTSRSEGPGLAVITNAGGPGVMAADALADYGMEPAALSEKTLAALNAVLPSHWSHSNPIDILGDAAPERFRKAIEICLDAREVNGLLIMFAPQALSDPSETAQTLTKILSGTRIPVFTAWIGGEDVEAGRQIFNQARIPTFDTPERAVRAFMDLCTYSRNIEMLQQIPANLPRRLEFDRDAARILIEKCLENGRSILTEPESKSLLSFYGIPVNRTEIARTEEEAAARAKEIGYPVALKVYSSDISHKTEAGGVRLNLNTPGEVRTAFADITAGAKKKFPNADIAGATVQEMILDPEYELIVGAKMDPDFGPVILFGSGGVMTEIFQDKALALPPLNRLLARRLMEETKIYQSLKGFRNRPPADLTVLEEILIRVSQLAADFSQIDALDINPLTIRQNRVCAVDARIILKSSRVCPPLHLVISPYPRQYEAHAVSKAGDQIFIRPIRPEDAPLLVEHFESLSEKSIYRRFFSPIKQLSPGMLARFTQIDYDREIALIALSTGESGEKLLAVSRIIDQPHEACSEFSVVVADPWQGRGIGAELLTRCLVIAKSRNVKFVHGMVLAENTQMLALGKKLGFVMEKIPGEAAYSLRISLDRFNDKCQPQ